MEDAYTDVGSFNTNYLQGFFGDYCNVLIFIFTA